MDDVRRRLAEGLTAPGPLARDRHRAPGGGRRPLRRRRPGPGAGQARQADREGDRGARPCLTRSAPAAPIGDATRPPCSEPPSRASAPRCPRPSLGNDVVGERIGKDHEWIVSRTGISNRRVVEPGGKLEPLAVEAAEAALEDAGVSARDVDMVLLATCSADDQLPAQAVGVAGRIGAGAGRGPRPQRRLHRLPRRHAARLLRAGGRPGRDGAGHRRRAPERHPRLERQAHGDALRRRRRRGRARAAPRAPASSAPSSCAPSPSATSSTPSTAAAS